MPEQWMTIAEAAAVMKIHPRTVERRAAAGKVQARRNDDGQVQVLIAREEPEPTTGPVQSDAFEAVREMADRQVDIAAGSASALVRAAQEQAMRAEHQLSIARQDAERFRREAQMALSLVAITLLFVIVAVAWCTHTITDARDRAANAVEVARQATAANLHDRDLLVTVSSERDKAEGQLAAYKGGLADVVESLHPHPATRPATLLERISNLFASNGT